MRNTSRRDIKSLLFLSLLLIPTLANGADKTYTEGIEQFVTTTCIPPSARTDGTLLTQTELDGSKTTLHFSTSNDFSSPIKTIVSLDIFCNSSIPITDFSSGIYYKAATFTDDEGRTSDFSASKSLEVIREYVPPPEPGNRVVDKLFSFYDFTKGNANDIVGTTNLTVEGSVAWEATGLHFTAGRAYANATNIISTLKSANAFTIETWIKSDNVTQTGPSRIVAISQDSGSQNFIIGQRDVDLELRLEGNANLEALSVMDTSLKHIVYTYDGSTYKVYVNNVLKNTQTVSGTLANNWRDTDLLNIGNENVNNRFYQGVISLVAIYSKALTVAEVDINYNAGIITTPPVIEIPNPPIINN